MDDEKLKKKIERQFDKELNKLGITDFTFERRDSLPEESELAKKSQYSAPRAHFFIKCAQLHKR